MGFSFLKLLFRRILGFHSEFLLFISGIEFITLKIDLLETTINSTLFFHSLSFIVAVLEFS